MTALTASYITLILWVKAQNKDGGAGMFIRKVYRNDITGITANSNQYNGYQQKQEW
jgi:hypothetical protein